MRRPLITGGIVLALAMGSMVGARAETVAVKPVRGGVDARFRHLDPQSIGRIMNVPAGIGRDRYVNALVELSTPPVAARIAAAEAARAAASGSGLSASDRDTSASGRDASASDRDTSASDRDASVTGPDTATSGGQEASAEVPVVSPTDAQRQVVAEQAEADPALRAAGATVEGRLSHVLNAVRIRAKVRDLDRVARVKGVRSVQVSPSVRPDNAGSGSYTGLGAAWAGGRRTGAGIVIGVIDTGVDYTHADFGGTGTPGAFRSARVVASQMPSTGLFPTAKVIGGFDFVGDAYDASDPERDVPQPDGNPIPCESHGTHVAGTAAGSGVTLDGKTFAGPYDGTVPADRFVVAPGAAPQAALRSYKVFGCDGSTSYDIVVAALDQAVRDQVDVVNLSLGSAFGTADDLGAKAVDNATRAGVVVVASAGNEGPNAYLSGTPASADTAVAVAAMDGGSPTRPGVTLTLPGSGGVVQGQNSNAATLAGLQAPVIVAPGPRHLGCRDADYAEAGGKIVVTVRGDCGRTERAVLGDKHGAVAVIMINDVAGLPPFEGEIDDVDIPFIGLDGSPGIAALLSRLAVSNMTITSTTIPNPGYGRVASFTSAGPRMLDSALKPDLAAPGVAVRSAGMGKGGGATTMSGTSMASPHVAGIAALVRQAHPAWTPRAVKAALVSTADPAEVTDYAETGGPARSGTGVVQAARATDTLAYAWTPDGRSNVSFGLQVMVAASDEDRTYRITNTSSRAITYDLAVHPAGAGYGASVKVSPRTLTVPPRTSRPVTVSMVMSAKALAALPGAAAMNRGALVTVSGVVVATPRGTGAGLYPLRTAYLMVPRSTSDVRSELVRSSRRPVDRAGRLVVTNHGPHAGTADLYAWTQSDPAGDVTDPTTPDLIDVGLQSLPVTVPGADGTSREDRVLVFAVNTARGISSHAAQELDVVIDVDGDGRADFVTVGADHGLLTTGRADGSVAALTIDVRDPDPQKWTLVDAWYAFAPADGSVVALPVYAGALGLTEAGGRFVFAVSAGSLLGDEIDTTAAATSDAFRPAVTSGNYVVLAHGRKAEIPVGVDAGQLSVQAVKGWLVVGADDHAGRPTADRLHLGLG